MTAKDLQRSIESISATGWKWSETDGWVSAEQLRLAPSLGHLYAYVLASKFLVPMQFLQHSEPLRIEEASPAVCPTMRV
jgi:hypothetical protein